MRVRVLNERGEKTVSLEGRSIIVAMCVGQLGSLLPHVVVPSILAAFLIPEWHLTGAQAGLLAGSGAAGYMLTVPVLATLTDRIDARKILIAGSALSALGTLLFGLFASGLWSGAFFNAIAGIGFAGAYMPGLKALTDRLRAGRLIPRDHALHVELFIRRRACRFWFPSSSRKHWGWRAAFLVTAHRPACDAVGLLAAEAGQAKARARPLAGFRAGVPQHPCDGFRARLWRALLRALWNPNLAGRVLDFCGR